MVGEGNPTVFIATDSSDVLAASGTLRTEYDVRTARTAEAALDTAADIAVDALVLAAYLPDGSGESLLEALRGRSVDARAGVLAGINAPGFPDFDLRIETPTTSEELERVVDRLISLGKYDDRLDELYQLAKQQAQPCSETGAVGDGGFDEFDEDILDAREAVDAALAEVQERDRGRLFTNGIRRGVTMKETETSTAGFRRTDRAGGER